MYTYSCIFLSLLGTPVLSLFAHAHFAYCLQITIKWECVHFDVRIQFHLRMYGIVRPMVPENNAPCILFIHFFITRKRDIICSTDQEHNCFAKARSEPERNEDLNILRPSVRLSVRSSVSCLTTPAYRIVSS